MEKIALSSDGIMLRPASCDLCVRRRAAEKLLPAVKRWLGADLGNRTDAELIRSLEPHLDSQSGYEICRDLERDGWTVDGALVEIMGGEEVRDALTELIEQWVRCIHPSLDLSPGDAVVWRGKHGVITSVDRKLSQYLVHTPDLSAGQNYVCDSEDVTKDVLAVAGIP